MYDSVRNVDAVNAVEAWEDSQRIVHCRECWYYRTDGLEHIGYDGECLRYVPLSNYVYGCDFCSWGERREP